MRFVFALFIALGLMATSAVSVPEVIGESSFVVAAQQPPTAQLEVDIDTDGGGDWWMSPIWIGIGVVALIAVIALIVAAARGGGTTVVKG